MTTSETIQALEKETANLELEFKRATTGVLLPGLVTVIGLCMAAFTLGLIMEEGNFIPAMFGLVIGIAGLVFAIKARKPFDETNRQLVAKREELAKAKQSQSDTK